MKKRVKIFVASDHAGFSMKQKIISYLRKIGADFEDIGPYKMDINDDYPDFAIKVAEKVASTHNSKGILICGTGIGMQIAANKVKGIRAALALDEYTARKSVEHNNINILVLRGRNFSSEKAKKIVRTWLFSSFSKKLRHIRRLKKISLYEKNHE